MTIKKVRTRNASRNPVSTQAVSKDIAYYNYDGSAAEVKEYQGFSVIKRKYKKPSGNVATMYVTEDLYVIPDIKVYLSFMSQRSKRAAAGEIQKEFSKQETEKTGRFVAKDQGVKIRSDATVASGKLDKEIDRSLSNGAMIRLDEAFPDVGIYESDPSDPNRKVLVTSPAVRARQSAVHGSRYQKEYILRTLHRLTLRRVPVDQIAQMFNVTVPTVYAWLDELKARLKSEASTLTITQIAGDTLSFYNEARALGLTIASTAEKIPDRVRGMEVALKAEQDKHKFLQVAGFYDTAKLGRETMEDEAAKKARAIINMTRNLLSGKFETDQTQDISDMIDPSDKVIL